MHVDIKSRCCAESIVSAVCDMITYEKLRDNINTDLLHSSWCGKFQMQPVLQQCLEELRQKALLPPARISVICHQLAWSRVRGLTYKPAYEPLDTVTPSWSMLARCGCMACCVLAGACSADLSACSRHHLICLLGPCRQTGQPIH